MANNCQKLVNVVCVWPLYVIWPIHYLSTSCPFILNIVAELRSLIQTPFFHGVFKMLSDIFSPSNNILSLRYFFDWFQAEGFGRLMKIQGVLIYKVLYIFMHRKHTACLALAGSVIVPRVRSILEFKILNSTSNSGF